MKVLVINEPFIEGFCRTQRWAARTRGRVLRAPDWLAYVTAVLEKEGIQAKLFDFPAAGWDKDRLRKLVRDHSPDFVVLDSTTPSISSDIGCCQIVKEVSNAKTIMVGPHVSALPVETLELAGNSLDVACFGEYDYTVAETVKKFPKLELVKGIAYWKDGKAVKNPPRPPIENLDELPFPAWHHLNLLKYFDGGKLYPYIDIISGRGCPNSCIFCLWPQVVHGTRYRMRSPGNVVDEIEYDIGLCPRVLQGGEFFFEDDCFTADKGRALLICEEIMRRKLKITFSVNTRVDAADPELFRTMKRAGCRELLVGFESGNQEILDRANKKITLAQSRKFMELAKSAGLEVHGCFVIGLPGETEKTAQETLDFALNLGLNTVQFSGAVPFPGTKFYEMAKENGWLVAKTWDAWLQEGEQTGVVHFPDFPKTKVDFFVDKGLKNFYFRPAFIWDFLLSTRNLSDLYRKLRGAKNFISYLLRR